MRKTAVLGAVYAQGDVLLRCVESLPQGAKTVAKKKRDKGGVVLQYGEATGHRHAFYDNAKLFHHEPTAKLIPGALYVGHVVVGAGGATLKHGKGPTDKGDHDPIEVPQGVFEVVRQREYSPEFQNDRYVED